MTRFQFLIGTIQTQLCSGSPLPAKAVSIPHRYDTNDKAWAKKIASLMVFQFLIGTIQTSSANSFVVSKIASFQFLIGTIQTRAEARQAFAEFEEFQFLIGTIQTCRPQNT